MRQAPKEKEVYEHFKGHRYQIIALAKDAESMEDLVVYQGTYEPYPTYVRPLAEFLGSVDRSKHPQAKQEERFRKCEINENEEMDPKLAAFLDAETYEEKLRILVSMEATISNRLINTMAIVLEVEVEEGELYERYDALKSALMTLERFECNRFR